MACNGPGGRSEPGANCVRGIFYVHICRIPPEQRIILLQIQKKVTSSHSYDQGDDYGIPVQNFPEKLSQG